MTPEAVEAAFKEKPALHRFPGSMAKRTHALCRRAGRGVRRRRRRRSGRDASYRRGAARPAPRAPGFGEEKAKIFLALLGKRFGVRPAGWEEAAAPFSDAMPRSIADIDSPETLADVREWKQAQKAKGKTKTD